MRALTHCALVLLHSTLTVALQPRFVSTTAWRNTLQTYLPHVPMLYGSPRAFTGKPKQKITIEHIVPSSVLNDYPTGSDDLRNLYLAPAGFNQLRSNYRFLLDESKPTQAGWITLPCGNFVHHRYRLFIPRPQDRGTISRTILAMHLSYGVHVERVALGGLATLHAVHLAYPLSLKEHNQRVLLVGGELLWTD